MPIKASETKEKTEEELSMNLKEAFTYQNFYDRLIGMTDTYLTGTNSTYTRIFTHLRHAVNPEAEDVEKVESQTEKLPYDVSTLIAFALDVLEEKDKMYAAIRKAKESAELDLDAAIGMNKARKNLQNVLNELYQKKEYDMVTTGRDYKFNVNGEQVPYTYEINEKLTVEYDKKDVKKIMKALDAKCNDVSKQVDRLNVNLVVDITPKYTLDMDLEDCLELFVK
jgi:hypothetical protein